jgi:arylsulfatase B
MQMIDVFPTLAAAAGVTPRNKLPLDGEDLWSNIQSGKTTERENLYFAVENETTMWLGVHHGEWKRVREVPASGGQPKYYLFRIVEDPTERNDVAAQNPEMVKELVAAIQKWQTLYPANGVRHTGAAKPGWTGPAQYAEAVRR